MNKYTNAYMDDKEPIFIDEQEAFSREQEEHTEIEKEIASQETKQSYSPRLISFYILLTGSLLCGLVYLTGHYLNPQSIAFLEKLGLWILGLATLYVVGKLGLIILGYLIDLVERIFGIICVIAIILAILYGISRFFI